MQRRREPVLVAAVGDLADELVDEVASVGEDQDAAGSRALDEAERGDRLAGAGRVLEPEAPACARVLGRLGHQVGGRLLPVLGLLLVWRQRLVLLGDLFGRAVPAVALELGGDRRTGLVAVNLGRGATRSVPALGGDRVLELGGKRREGPGEHVDLVLGELGPVRQQHRLGGEQPLEPEQQRVAAPPLGRGGLAAGVELRQGSLDGAAPRGPGSDVVDGLVVEQDRLARELAHALELIACDRAGRALCDVDGFRHEKKFSGAPRSCGWWRGRCKLAGGSPARSWFPS